MRKILFLSLLLSFPLFGMEDFNFSGNASVKINPHAHQVINQAVIKLSGNSQITINSINDLRIDLDSNATLSLPHPAEKKNLDDLPILKSISVTTTVGGSNQNNFTIQNHARVLVSVLHP